MDNPPPFAIEYTTALPGGLSERNHLFSAEREKYVLHDLESEYERYMMIQTAQLGVAPKILASMDKQVVMEYIEEPTITPEIARLHSREIGATLKKAHSVPLFSEKGISVEEANRIRYEYIRAHSEKMPVIFEEAIIAMEKFEDAIEELAALQSPLTVNIHVDSHPRNLFWIDGRGFLIIDWEASTHGHPYFDLASLATLLALDEHAEEELLEGYFDRPPTFEERREYELLKKIRWAYTSMVDFMWACRLLEKGTPPPNPDLPPEHPWPYYMESFATTLGMSSLQFFIDVARISLSFTHPTGPK